MKKLMCGGCGKVMDVHDSTAGITCADCAKRGAKTTKLVNGKPVVEFPKKKLEK